MKENSGFDSRERLESRIWSGLLKNAEKADSGREIGNFFDCLLSEGEKRMVARRMAILSLIKAGKSYKEIGRILWVSPKTISALKRSVIRQAPYKSSYFYSKKSREEKEKRIKGLPRRTILDYWLNLPLPKKTGRGRWKFLYYQG